MATEGDTAEAVVTLSPGRAPERPPQLHMRRSLASLPRLAIPEGYELRPLQPDDVAAWVELLTANAELGEWTIERAARYFGPESKMPLDGSFFVTRDGEPAATAQLHLQPDGPYAPTPELGWVAAHPRHRGHGLGYVVCLAVLHYAAARGHCAIFLRTDDWRLPAIRTYLKLGFEPWIYDPSAPERWRIVRERLSPRPH